MNIALESSDLVEKGPLYRYRPRVTLEIGIYKKGLNDAHKRDSILAEFLANVSTLDVKKLHVSNAVDWSTFERAFGRHVFTSAHTVFLDFCAAALIYRAKAAPSDGFPALRHLVVSKQRQSTQGQWREAWNYLTRLLARATDPKLSVRMLSSDAFKYGTIGFPRIDAQGVARALELTSSFIDERLEGDCARYKVLEK
ncbi:unnamed protein product [Peniophora sp. CBMAI 1063]|nr:unnamed protein product [Peniophora sp. CBMAI 1063]